MTSEELQAIQERIRTTLDLFELAEEMFRQRLRRERPAAASEEIEQELDEWRLARPGAEIGDAPGRQRPWR